MLKFKSFILDEEQFDKAHREKLATAKRGKRRPADVRKRISAALKGQPSNHTGKSHDDKARKRISVARGHYNPIGSKKWIINRSSEKTWRRTKQPSFVKFKRGRNLSSPEQYDMKDRVYIRRFRR